MIILVDVAGRLLTTEWRNADGAVTRIEGGEVLAPEATSYEVEFREVATGAKASVTYNLAWGEGSLYWWTDGNMGCDCNRALSFWRAQHPEATLDEEPDFACGEGAYRVAIRANGVVLHDEKAEKS